ncbi:MAG: tetratricopeptide repeat protein [Phycisphaerales bacterium]
MSSPRFQQALAEYQANRLEQAETLLRSLLRTSPGDVNTLALLGTVLGDKGVPEQAEFFLRRALSIDPSNGMLWGTLGDVLSQQGRNSDAIEAFKRAVQHWPDEARLHRALCAALCDDGKPTEAIVHGRRAVELAPDDPWTYNNLLGALGAAGLTEQAIEVAEHGIRMHPRAGVLKQAVAFNLCYLASSNAAATAGRQFAMGRQLSDLIPNDDTPFTNTREPDRALRIGLLSPDLRKHSVAYFLESFLPHIDRSRFTIYGYQCRSRDAMSAKLAAYCADFHTVDTIADAQINTLVRSERIDILIDLAGHSSHTRLSAMVRRCAPVQATYLGYPATTGCRNIDYRIVDAITDPPGPVADSHCTEQLYRLPRCFLCYSPPGAPEPSINGGRPITFASLNNTQKLSPHALAAWGRLLVRIPDSRLVIKTLSASAPEVSGRIRAALADTGADLARVEIRPYLKDFKAHLASYADIDIALDPWPYNGTTTTCETLWMGVPVVNLRGDNHVSRVGESLLTAVGLQELVAPDIDSYIDAAARLAADEPRRRHLRTSLRQQMAASDLCNGPSLARALEAAWRQMWRTYCAAN